MEQPIAQIIDDGWEISGVTTALSGAALGIGYSIAGVSDLTGGAGAGVDTASTSSAIPTCPRGDRTPLRAFATECVAPPSAGDEPRRHGARRRDHRARLPELGPLVREEHPVRRHRRRCSSAPSSTTRSTTSSSRPSTRTRCSTPPGSRPTPSSGGIRRAPVAADRVHPAGAVLGRAAEPGSAAKAPLTNSHSCK